MWSWAQQVNDKPSSQQNHLKIPVVCSMNPNQVLSPVWHFGNIGKILGCTSTLLFLFSAIPNFSFISFQFVDKIIPDWGLKCQETECVLEHYFTTLLFAVVTREPIVHIPPEWRICLVRTSGRHSFFRISKWNALCRTFELQYEQTIISAFLYRSTVCGSAKTICKNPIAKRMCTTNISVMELNLIINATESCRLAAFSVIS